MRKKKSDATKIRELRAALKEEVENRYVYAKLIRQHQVANKEHLSLIAKLQMDNRLLMGLEEHLKEAISSLEKRLSKEQEELKALREKHSRLENELQGTKNEVIFLQGKLTGVKVLNKKLRSDIERQRAVREELRSIIDSVMQS